MSDLMAGRMLPPEPEAFRATLREARERAARSEHSRVWGHRPAIRPAGGPWSRGASTRRTRTASSCRPSRSLAALGSLLTTPDFWDAIWTSAVALIIGFVAAVVIGVPIGLAMGRIDSIRNIIDPYINLVLVMPMAVLMPIVLIALGISLTARIVVIFVFCLPFVVVPCLTGVRVIEKHLLDMGRTYGASELQLWRNVLIPGALPAILSGLAPGLRARPHRHGGRRAHPGGSRRRWTRAPALRSQLAYDYVFAVVFVIIAQAVLGVGLLRAFEARTAGTAPRPTRMTVETMATPRNAAGIELTGVSKLFRRRKANGETDVFAALDTVSLHVPEAQFVSIIGPSGCGKTTLLRIVAGLEHPQTGEVNVAGQLIWGPARSGDGVPAFRAPALG